jgi:hypothetical protein
MRIFAAAGVTPGWPSGRDEVSVIVGTIPLARRDKLVARLLHGQR